MHEDCETPLKPSVWVPPQTHPIFTSPALCLFLQSAFYASYLKAFLFLFKKNNKRKVLFMLRNWLLPLMSGTAPVVTDTDTPFLISASLASLLRQPPWNRRPRERSLLLLVCHFITRTIPKLNETPLLVITGKWCLRLMEVEGENEFIFTGDVSSRVKWLAWNDSIPISSWRQRSSYNGTVQC